VTEFDVWCSGLVWLQMVTGSGVCGAETIRGGVLVTVDLHGF